MYAVIVVSSRSLRVRAWARCRVAALHDVHGDGRDGGAFLGWAVLATARRDAGPALIGCGGLPAGRPAAPSPRSSAVTASRWGCCPACRHVTLFAPMAADISHWFTRRRGLAVAIVITGTYFAGALWPPLVQASLDARGWRETFIAIAILMAVTMLPLARCSIKAAALIEGGGARSTGAGRRWASPPARFNALLCAAGLAAASRCSAPGTHCCPRHRSRIRRPARPKMLSLMLSRAFISRIGPVHPDRIGGTAPPAARLGPAGVGVVASGRRHAHPCSSCLGRLRPLPGADRALYTSS